MGHNKGLVNPQRGCDPQFRTTGLRQKIFSSDHTTFFIMIHLCGQSNGNNGPFYTGIRYRQKSISKIHSLVIWKKDMHSNDITGI